MRIISKTKEFYDFGSAWGIDSDVVWVREPRAIEWAEISSREFDGIRGARISGLERRKSANYAELVTIILNGKVTRWVATVESGFYENATWVPGEEYREKLKEAYTGSFFSFDLGYWSVETAPYRSKRVYTDWNITDALWVNERFDSPLVMLGCQDYSGLQRNGGGCYGAVNPVGTNFLSATMNATEIFQEIQMFVSRERTPPDPGFTDKDRIRAAGLDYRTSFRKEKQNKK